MYTHIHLSIYLSIYLSADAPDLRESRDPAKGVGESSSSTPRRCQARCRHTGKVMAVKEVPSSEDFLADVFPCYQRGCDQAYIELVFAPALVGH